MVEWELTQLEAHTAFSAAAAPPTPCDNINKIKSNIHIL